MIRSWLLILAFIVASPVCAQDVEEPLVGAGPKGRYTLDQGEILVLREVPGEILKRSLYRHRNQTFYIYNVLAEDNGVYDIEINALTGLITVIEVESIGREDEFPFDTVSKDMAIELALAHVLEETKGQSKPQLRSAKIGAYREKPVYIIRVKKAGDKYDVMVDAIAGRILDLIEVG